VWGGLRADQSSLGESDEGRNVAAGNAVLADQETTALLKTVRPDGTALAKDLATVLGVKDAAHYGTVFVSATVLRSTRRATTRLVAAAEAAVQTSGS
jgi:hypothetical protein